MDMVGGEILTPEGTDGCESIRSKDRVVRALILVFSHCNKKHFFSFAPRFL
jgi:hypothetical protein